MNPAWSTYDQSSNPTASVSSTYDPTWAWQATQHGGGTSSAPNAPPLHVQDMIAGSESFDDGSTFNHLDSSNFLGQYVNSQQAGINSGGISGPPGAASAFVTSLYGQDNFNSTDNTLMNTGSTSAMSQADIDAMIFGGTGLAAPPVSSAAAAMSSTYASAPPPSQSTYGPHLILGGQALPSSIDRSFSTSSSFGAPLPPSSYAYPSSSTQAPVAMTNLSYTAQTPYRQPPSYPPPAQSQPFPAPPPLASHSSYMPQAWPQPPPSFSPIAPAPQSLAVLSPTSIHALQAHMFNLERVSNLQRQITDMQTAIRGQTAAAARDAAIGAGSHDRSASIAHLVRECNGLKGQQAILVARCNNFVRGHGGPERVDADLRAMKLQQQQDHLLQHSQTPRGSLDLQSHPPLPQPPPLHQQAPPTLYAFSMPPTAVTSFPQSEHARSFNSDPIANDLSQFFNYTQPHPQPPIHSQLPSQAQPHPQSAPPPLSQVPSRARSLPTGLKTQMAAAARAKALKDAKAQYTTPPTNGIAALKLSKDTPLINGVTGSPARQLAPLPDRAKDKEKDSRHPTLILAQGAPGKPTLEQLQGQLTPEAFHTALKLVLERKNIKLLDSYTVQGDKPVDLYRLYQNVLVKGRGGDQVTKDERWHDMARLSALPTTPKSALDEVRHIYETVLAPFELVWSRTLLNQRDADPTPAASNGNQAPYSNPWPPPSASSVPFRSPFPPPPTTLARAHSTSSVEQTSGNQTSSSHSNATAPPPFVLESPAPSTPVDEATPTTTTPQQRSTELLDVTGENEQRRKRTKSADAVLPSDQTSTLELPADMGCTAAPLTSPEATTVPVPSESWPTASGNELDFDLPSAGIVHWNTGGSDGVGGRDIGLASGITSASRSEQPDLNIEMGLGLGAFNIDLELDLETELEHWEARADEHDGHGEDGRSNGYL